MDLVTLRRLYRSRDFLAAHAASPLRLEDAARAAALSPYHFHRQFVRTFGETPREFLTRVRIEEARRMLARDHASVTDICMAVGYESPASFSLLFRQRTGMGPSEFRKSMRRIFPVPEVAVYRYVPSCFLWFHGVRGF